MYSVSLDSFSQTFFLRFLQVAAVSMACYFLLLSNILLYEYSTVCLSVLLLMSISTVSTSGYYKQSCLTIFQSGFRILHSASRIGEFWCITFFLLIFGIIRFFNLSHSSGCMVISHYGFNLYLSINDFKHLFMSRPVIHILFKI